MSSRGLGLVIGAVLVLLLVSNTLYIVKETERAVVLRFGEVVNPDIAVGLHAKFPWADQVRKFDGRIITLDAAPERFLTIEKKPLDVDFYAKWRIKDTSKFYTSSGGDELRAQQNLTQRIKTGLRNQFGERTMHEVVSGSRDQMMVDLTKELNVIAQKEFGIEVVDVRVKRIDLPESVSQKVFDRMASERAREAREYRSTGAEQAEFIRAAADREKIVIESNAYRDAERLKGEGDARATVIYAAAYGKDPEFYSFVRSLNAYRNSFDSRSDVMLVDPKGDFFKYLNNPRGAR